MHGTHEWSRSWRATTKDSLALCIWAVPSAAREFPTGRQLKECGGPAGLLAGRGFAVHMLKANLEIGVARWRATIRTYVDDITLSYVGASARDDVRALAKELPHP